MKAAVASVLTLCAALAVPQATLSQDATPAPATAAPTAAPVAERVYTDPASTIRTHVDQLFLISLDANRTTGYTWQLDPASDALVQILGSSYAIGDATRLGAGGQQIWILRATTAGKTALTFRYIRPFDKTTLAGARQLTFQVEVDS